MIKQQNSNNMRKTLNSQAPSERKTTAGKERQNEGEPVQDNKQ